MSVESTLARGWMEIAIKDDKAIEEQLKGMNEQVQNFGKQIESGFYEKTIRATRQSVKELDKLKKKAEEVNRTIIHGRMGGKLVGASEQIGSFVDKTRGINSFALKTNLAFGGLMTGAASSAGQFGLELFGKSAQLAGNALMRPFIPALVEVSAFLQRFADKTSKLIEEYPILTKAATTAALALGGLAVAGLAASGIRSFIGLAGAGAGLIGRGLGLAGIGMGAAGGAGALAARGAASAGSIGANIAGAATLGGLAAGGAAKGGSIASKAVGGISKVAGKIGAWGLVLAGIEAFVESIADFDENGKRIKPGDKRKSGDGFKVAVPNLSMPGGQYYDATGYREGIQSKALALSELDQKVMVQEMTAARKALDKIVEINQRNAIQPQQAPDN